MGNTSVLVMDAEGLHTLASTIEAKAAEFDSHISNFDTKVGQITDAAVWSGNDSVQFKAAADGFKTNLMAAANTLHSIASNFETTASNYDAAYEESNTAAGNLGA